MQRSSDVGEYDIVRGASFSYTDPVVDADFTAMVYPKYIKVVSFVEPVSAEVVESTGGQGGGSISIDNQDKSLDVTENGTYEVIADSGYTGLGKVTVNVDVAVSGSLPAYIGFEIYQPGFGDGSYYRYSIDTENGTTWDSLISDYFPAYNLFGSTEDGYVTYEGSVIYKNIGDSVWGTDLSDPVQVSDNIESRKYYIPMNTGGV